MDVDILVSIKLQLFHVWSKVNPLFLSIHICTVFLLYKEIRFFIYPILETNKQILGKPKIGLRMSLGKYAEMDL